ncbi:MAG: hypothetical protein ACK5Y2_12175 [Bdellovibrionales bacterium]
MHIASANAGCTDLTKSIGVNFGDYGNWKSILNVTNSTLEYLSLVDGEMQQLRIERAGAFFVISREVSFAKPSWTEYPNHFSYTVKAKRITK